MTNDMTIVFNPESLGFRFIHVQACILAIYLYHKKIKYVNFWKNCDIQF